MSEPKRSLSSGGKGNHGMKGSFGPLSRGQSRGSITSKGYWNGLLSWVSDCPKCPLLYFSADYTQMLHAESDLRADLSLTVNSKDDVNSEKRHELLVEAKNLIANHHVGTALSVLLDLTKNVSYKLNEEEFALLISTAEIVVRNRLHGARQMTMRDVSHAIGFVKANIRRASLTAAQLTEEEVNEEKEEFRNLLLTLVDVIQCIRKQMAEEYVSLGSESTNTMDTLTYDGVMESSSSSGKPVQSQRFNLYLTFFSLLIQSAFLEGGFVSGNVFINRLVGNAEEAYYMTHDCKDERIEFMKPLGAYIYGRLWCETGEDEGSGAYFLSEYYEKHGAEFETLLQSSDKDKLHSTYLCNMRRIRQTVHKYHHLL